MPAGISLAFFGALFSSSVGAQAPPVALDWLAPDTCPTAAVVRENVERILGEATHGRRSVAATAQVHAPSPGEPWRVELALEVSGVRTLRQFAAESCDALAAATALIVALAVEVGSPWPSAPESASKQQAFAAPVKDGDGSSSVVTLNSLADWRTLPRSPGLGLEVGLGRRWPLDRWRLGASLTTSMFLPRELDYAPAAGYLFVDFWLVSLSSRVCALRPLSRLEMGGCAGALFEVMRAVSSLNNPEAVEDGFHRWLSFSGAGLATWTLSSRTRLFFRAEIVLPTTHATFRTPDNEALVYRVPQVAARAALGLELHFL